jgi:hypothetical protein
MISEDALSISLSTANNYKIYAAIVKAVVYLLLRIIMITAHIR